MRHETAHPPPAGMTSTPNQELASFVRVPPTVFYFEKRISKFQIPE
jgi:hypothetical protein